MKKIFIVMLASILILSSCVSSSGSSSAYQTGMTQGPFESQLPADTVDYNSVIPPDPPYVPKEEVVSFLAVGDNIIYNGQLREGLANAKDRDDVEYDFTPMYKNVSDFISSFDLAFVNQETVMAGKSYGYSQYPDFNSPQELGDNLISVGFDIINIASNHMLDMWYDGLEKTIDFWKSKDVLMVGGYDDEDDFMNIRYVEKNGIKIAVVGFTYHPKNKTDKLPFIPQIKDELIKKWINKAKESSDFIVVSMHWGEEYNQTPTAEQKRLAQYICDLGADVIIGHHTHCIQPIEWLENEKGEKTLCFYSLGNFTSETDETVSLPGGIATFDIVKHEFDGISIKNVVFVPTVMDYRSSFNKNTVYFLEDYSDELCKGHNIISYFKKELNMKMLHEYVHNVIDKKYLTDKFLECAKEYVLYE